MIQIPHENLLQPDPVGQVRANPSAWGASGAAMVEVGRNIGKIGDEAQNLLLQLGKAKDEAAFSEMRTMQRQLESDMAQFVAANPDQEAWQPELEKRMLDAENRLGAIKFTNGGEVRARQHFTEWSAGQAGRLAVQATEMQISRGRATLMDEYKEGVRMNDEGRMNAATDGLLAYETPEEVERLRRDGLRRIELNDFLAEIDDDPVGAVGALQEGSTEIPEWMDDGTRRKLLKSAEASRSRLQREQAQKIGDSIDRKDIASKETLENALEQSDLDETQRAEFMFHWEQSQPIDRETRFAVVDSLNELHDAYKAGDLQLEDYREAHDEIAQQVYAFGSRDGAGGLRQRLYALDPAKWNGDNLAESEDVSRRRDVERIGATFAKQGAFGEVDDEALPAKRAFQARDAERARERVEEAVMRELKRDPNADIDAAFRRAYMNEIMPEILPDPRDTLAIPEPTRPDYLDGPPGARNSTPDTPVGGSLKAMVKQFEAGGEPQGFHPKAYWDHGQWSIGYGTKAKKGETITKEEAAARLEKELASHRKRVVDEAKRVGMEFSDHELDALTSFDFNTGKIRQLLAGGSRTKEEIASKMLLYRNASGVPLAGLIRRRRAESQLFRNGYGS